MQIILQVRSDGRGRCLGERNMERVINLEEISDGRRYNLNDMVKADCGDCQGCSDCCREMEKSILLDPLDIHRLCTGLGLTFDQLLEDRIQLNLVDGIILPNLKMSETDHCCTFLNEEGRCSIHSIRPGICRIFPLGRIYENGSFQYFLQIYECSRENRAKVKVKKWIDTPECKKNQEYLIQWHYFIKNLGDQLNRRQDETLQRAVILYVLKQFFQTPYEEPFYDSFFERLQQGKDYFSRLGVIPSEG